MIWNLLAGNKKPFKDIKTFCLFIGYPRSGHTLYGALLDAHPNCIISHELGVLRLMKEGKPKYRIFKEILLNSREYSNSGRKNEGYAYEVKDQWQGKYHKLQLIGDKRGGRTSLMLSTEPELLYHLSDVLDIQIKILHVYRNPFDNIASRSKGGNLNKRKFSVKILKNEIERHFVQVETNNKIRQEGRFEVLDIKHEDFVASPEAGLEGICNFFGLEPTSKYLKDCAAIVFQKPHKTRFDIDFPDEQKMEISKRIKKYDFLAGYSFND
ncbi:MAG: sulfotransferase [Bacteroidales bacterium]|nr:sulfotransferase [Bacteroidales bacterium]MCF6341739.1 sulfotransferase [Bacteroidales bacterium]